MLFVGIAVGMILGVCITCTIFVQGKDEAYMEGFSEGLEEGAKHGRSKMDKDYDRHIQ